MISNKIDAVLPLKINDFERFKILYASIKKNFFDLGIFWVVVVDNEFETLSALIQDPEFRLIRESELIPEFQILEDQVNFWKVPGWYKQQLIKIAIAEKIETSFYITFDADVICVKPTYITDFIINDMAICCLHPASKKWYKWYSWAERVLKVPHVTGLFHNFTPAILSKNGMLELHDYLTSLASKSKSIIKFNKKDWLFILVRLMLYCKGHHQDCEYLDSWRSYLIKNLPWTEYALYYTFLEATNSFRKYHILKQDYRIYTFENSVWNREQWDTWMPEKAFSGKNQYNFCIVQSNIGINADSVWQKVSPYLG